METIRIERGVPAEDAVPSHAYYGARTKHAMERMINTGKRYKYDLLVALASLKKCAAIAEVEAGRLDPRIGAQIERAAKEIASGRWHEQFIFEPNRCGCGEWLTLNMNEVLANRAIELLGEERGSYHIVSPDWHAETSLHPNRFFTAAFQLASLEYTDLMNRLVQVLPHGVRDGVIPVLTSLKDRLCIINGEQFESKIIARAETATGYPLRSGRTAHDHFETAYDKISSSMKLAMSRLEPAMMQMDSIEMKAVVIQISAFHDMISFMTRSGFPAQGMEEVAAYYAWQCQDLFYQALLKINQIYH